MKITKRQQKYLLDHIISIQTEVGFLAQNIDNAKASAAVGQILLDLSVLTNDLVHSEIITPNCGEMYF